MSAETVDWQARAERFAIKIMALTDALQEALDQITTAKAEAWQEGHEGTCEDAWPTCERFHPNPYKGGE